MTFLPARYSAGTVTVAANATAVTATGALFLTNQIAPDDLLILNGLSVPIAAVGSETTLTLARGWPGSSVTNGAYHIQYTPKGELALGRASQLLAISQTGPLTSIAALSTAANQGLFFSGSGVAETYPLTAFGRSLGGVATAAAARTTLGLGTAATADVTTGATDTTTGRVLRVGDFGLGLPVQLTGTTPLHQRNLRPGIYHYYADPAAGGIAGGPETEQRLHTLIVTSTGVGGRIAYYSFRTAGNNNDPRLWIGHQTADNTEIAWQLVYSQRTVVGQVAQASGVPTGALFERGSNANGAFVRLADGLQICTHSVTATLAIDTAFLGGFRSAAQTWTYPAAFAAVPVVHVGVRNSTAFGAVTTNVPGVSSVQFAVTAVSTQTSAAREAALTAVGRWF